MNHTLKVLTFVMDKVEVCTGSVPDKNLSKLRENMLFFAKNILF
jgi:hypothetical protein